MRQLLFLLLLLSIFDAAGAEKRPNPLDELPTKQHNASEGRGNALDAAADQILVNRRLGEEQNAYRPKASGWCHEKMKQVDACYAKASCTRPPESPSQDACMSIPRAPRQPDPEGIVLYKGMTREEMAERSRDRDREHARKWDEWRSEYRAWESRYGETSKQCQALPKLREAYAACTKQNAAACDPAGLAEHSNCVDQRLDQAGPQESEVRSRLQAEWAARERGADKGSARPAEQEDRARQASLSAQQEAQNKQAELDRQARAKQQAKEEAQKQSAQNKRTNESENSKGKIVDQTWSNSGFGTKLLATACADMEARLRRGYGACKDQKLISVGQCKCRGKASWSCELHYKEWRARDVVCTER